MVPTAPVPAGSPRTVLYVHSSAGRYGADRQLLITATGLDPARYRALVVLGADGELAGDLRAAGVEVVARPALAVLRRALFSPAGVGRVAARAGIDAVALGRLARVRRVALVHSNTSVTLGGAAAARVARVPHVWSVREIYADFARWWPLYRRLLAGGAAALACSSASVCAQFGADPRARVVPEAVSPGVAVRRERAVARRALGLPEDAFVCAVLGRLSAWKGQDVLARALAEAPLRATGAIGLVAGAPWPGEERHERAQRALAATLGLGERLRLLGFRDDPPTLYGAADVVVVPSTRPDPLPNAALEAAAAGCCVVAAAHGGLPEIVRDGETGVLVAPGDHRALAAALATLAADPARRERLGAAAAADAGARFAPMRLLERVQALYDELLDPATASSGCRGGSG
jgi:glycosyltransferase involved in cell wall biosynthesis